MYISPIIEKVAYNIPTLRFYSILHPKAQFLTTSFDKSIAIILSPLDESKHIYIYSKYPRLPKNSKFHNPSPNEERFKIQQPRRITTNRRVRWITSLLSFSFPTKIRPPRGAIYEFTPQMRIMALIRDIWLEHCRGSPHACPRTTLCTVVSHRWCNRNPYIHICVFRLPPLDHYFPIHRSSTDSQLLTSSSNPFPLAPRDTTTRVK